MKYDFDTVVDRRNTNSLKYDFHRERGKAEDLMPLWVADMDFQTPKEVIDALRQKASHGIFGYSEPKEEYFSALVGWFSSRHGWTPERDKFVLTCGVVFAICMAIRALTQEGDSVLVCQPVYYPFEESIVVNRRKLVVSELIETNGVYEIDFEDFERKIVEKEVKLFLLCSPHNPVGRVWTREELLKIGEICAKHGVFVVADEIHADFTYAGYKHIPFASLSEAFAQNSITCLAPTKTFNLAGLHNSNIYIPNSAVRRLFRQELDRAGYSQSNIMGIVACQAAYTYGGEWLDELKVYLQGNLDFVRSYLREALPEIRLIEPQGTYLLWLDCRALGLSTQELSAFMQQKAKLWLDDGYVFGKGGKGFERINIACPRSLLKEALERIARAIKEG